MTITREGKRFLIAVLIIGFAALNTGNNLMYLIFSMMLSILLVSLVVPFVNLHNLSIDMDIDEPVFARSPAKIRLSLRNGKKLIPSYSLRFSLPAVTVDTIYIDKVPPQETAVRTWGMTFPRRGLFAAVQSIIVTEFPFIFFSFARRPSDAAQVLVYPEIRDASSIFRELHLQSSIQGGSKRGPSEEFLHLREFRYGDQIRHIHWKATAKRAALMVKEFYRDECDRITVFLDDLSYGSPERFEKAVSFAASIVSEFIHNSYTVRVVTCQKIIPFGAGVEHLYKILDILAVIGESGDDHCPVKESFDEKGILIASAPSSPFMRFAPFVDRVYYAGDL